MHIEEQSIIQVHCHSGKYRVVTAYRHSNSAYPSILVLRLNTMLESHGSIDNAILSLKLRLTGF